MQSTVATSLIKSALQYAFTSILIAESGTLYKQDALIFEMEDWQKSALKTSFLEMILY